MSEMTWKYAILWILTNADKHELPMSCSTILERIQDDRLRENYPPSAYYIVNGTLNSHRIGNAYGNLEMFMQDEYSSSWYPVNNIAAADMNAMDDQYRRLEMAPITSEKTITKQIDEDTTDVYNSDVIMDSVANTNLIAAMGYMWKRSEVDWITQPDLWGVEETSRTRANHVPINFSLQSGVYVLYKDAKITYIGQSINIGARLTNHTKDKHSQRWNRFSWFGLKPFDSDLKLIDPPDHYSMRAILDGLEGVLIEVLEAFGNDSSGNNISGTRFLQYVQGRIVAP